MREASELKDKVLNYINNPESGIIAALDDALVFIKDEIEPEDKLTMECIRAIGVADTLYAVLNGFIGAGIVTRDEIQNCPSDLHILNYILSLIGQEEIIWS